MVRKVRRSNDARGLPRRGSGILGRVQNAVSDYVPPQDSQVRRLAGVVARNPLSFLVKLQEAIRDEMKLKAICLQKSRFPDTKWHFNHLGVTDLMLPWGKNGGWERLHLASVAKLAIRQVYNGMCAFDILDSRCKNNDFNYAFETEKTALAELKTLMRRQQPVYSDSIAKELDDMWHTYRKWFLAAVAVCLMTMILLTVLCFLVCVEKSLSVRRRREDHNRIKRKTALLKKRRA